MRKKASIHKARLIIRGDFKNFNRINILCKSLQRGIYKILDMKTVKTSKTSFVKKPKEKDIDKKIVLRRLIAQIILKMRNHSLNVNISSKRHWTLHYCILMKRDLNNICLHYGISVERMRRFCCHGSWYEWKHLDRNFLLAALLNRDRKFEPLMKLRHGEGLKGWIESKAVASKNQSINTNNRKS